MATATVPEAATAQEAATTLIRLIEQWAHAPKVHDLLNSLLLGLCHLTPMAYREATGAGVSTLSTLLNYSHAEKALRLQQQAAQDFDRFLSTLEELRLALLEIK